jgi:hypothetical protein
LSVWASGGGVYVVHVGIGQHTRIIGCSRHVVVAVLCASCGVADGWLDTAVRRQREWARGVRAGAVGSGRGDKPGDGGLHNLDGKVLRGLCMCGDVREAPCMHV